MKKCYLVDDQEIIIETVSLILEKCECHVIPFNRAKKALIESFKDKPKLLITDLDMPYINGLKLYKLMKRSLPNLKVVFITGQKRNKVIDEINKLGLNILFKPFDFKQLIGLLKNPEFEQLT